MAMATDPVCGMRVDTDEAAATAEHDGTTYYFCSQACRDTFVAATSAKWLNFSNIGQFLSCQLFVAARSTVESRRPVGFRSLADSEIAEQLVVAGGRAVAEDVAI